ncbi:hypothetical protein [Enemella dayhoffiae]|nr:hypothetical protein [Enemella dayhoffiae]
MTQPELVRKSGLQRQHVHSLLKNETLGRMPEERTIAGLAKAFPHIGEGPFLTKAAISIGVPVDRLTVVEPDYAQLSNEALLGILRNRLERGGQKDAGTAEAEKTTAAIRSRRERFLRHNGDNPLIRTIESDLADAESTGDAAELERILDRLDALMLAEDHGELIDQFRRARFDIIHVDKDVIVQIRRGDQVPADLLQQLAAYQTGLASGREEQLRGQEKTGEENQDEEE